MLAFELRGVYGGWDQAVFGPSDQVDYVVRTGEDSMASYDSVHSLLKLYDLARLEQPTHPRFLGFQVQDLAEGIGIEMHGFRFATTYADLRAAMEPFLEDLFLGLDDETLGDRDEHVAKLADSGEIIVDVSDLYDRLVEET
jgi:hypothetical protein